MNFDTFGIIAALESCFALGGAADFRAFLGEHLRSTRWIIAADFNVELQHNAAWRVFAFSCYPTTGNYENLIIELNDVFPTDFKNIREMNKAHIHFLENKMCFTFVIILPPARITFNSVIREENLNDVRGELARVKDYYSTRSTPRFHNSGVNDLLQYALSNSASLELLENTSLLGVFLAFITRIIASHCPVDLIGWFPDRDKMTTVAKSAWAPLAHLMFTNAWHLKYPRQNPPEIGFWDHKVKGDPSAFDPLIKVPDFLSAVLSRWHLSSNTLALPDGMSERGQKRYRDLISAWIPLNERLWLCRLFTENECFRTSRVVGAKSKTQAREFVAQRHPKGLAE